jgi:hypothetical protein
LATSPYTIANKAILNKSLREEAWWKTSWAKWAGFASKQGAADWKVPNTPIAVFRDFIQEGRDNMLVPMIRQLQEYPQLGIKTMKGNTEDPRFLWHKVFVSLVRKGFKLPNKVSAQKIRWAVQAKKYLPLLSNWWSRWENHDVTRAFLEGYSYALTASAADGGEAKDKRYHKNFWVYDGAGKNFANNPTYAVGTGPTKNNVITGLLAGTAAADIMSTDTLEAIIPELSYGGIMPITNMGSKPFFPMIINSRQAKDLRSDSDWLAGKGRADGMGINNAIFNGALGTWGPLVLYVDDVIARLPYATSGAILDFFNYSEGAIVGDSTNGYNGMYGKVQKPSTMATGTSAQNTAAAIILGENCMSKGIAGHNDEDPISPGDSVIKRKLLGLGFAMEIDDFGMVKEIGSEQYYGYHRNDFFDEEVGTTPTAEGEPQSAIVCTSVT